MGVCKVGVDVGGIEVGMCGRDLGKGKEELGFNEGVPYFCRKESGLNEESPGIGKEEFEFNEEVPGFCKRESGLNEEGARNSRDESRLNKEDPGLCEGELEGNEEGLAGGYSGVCKGVSEIGTPEIIRSPGVEGSLGVMVCGERGEAAGLISVRA